MSAATSRGLDGAEEILAGRILLSLFSALFLWSVGLLARFNVAAFSTQCCCCICCFSHGASGRPRCRQQRQISSQLTPPLQISTGGENRRGESRPNVTSSVTSSPVAGSTCVGPTVESWGFFETLTRLRRAWRTTQVRVCMTVAIFSGVRSYCLLVLDIQPEGLVCRPDSELDQGFCFPSVDARRLEPFADSVLLIVFSLLALHLNRASACVNHSRARLDIFVSFAAAIGLLCGCLALLPQSQEMPDWYEGRRPSTQSALLLYVHSILAALYFVVAALIVLAHWRVRRAAIEVPIHADLLRNVLSRLLTAAAGATVGGLAMAFVMFWLAIEGWDTLQQQPSGVARLSILTLTQLLPCAAIVRFNGNAMLFRSQIASRNRMIALATNLLGPGNSLLLRPDLENYDVEADNSLDTPLIIS